MLSGVATGNGLIGAVDAGGTLAVWDAATLQVRATAQVAATLETTSIAPGDLHGRTVVLTGTDSGVIRWFDRADLTEFAPPGRFAERTAPTGYARNPRHWPGPGAVTQLEVSGTMVISAAGNTVTCADIATGEPSGPPLVHRDKVWAILPALLDGVPAVATSCADQTLRIWHIATGNDTENQFDLATVHATGGDQVTSHVYDANGGLLIREEPGGTTLYAAGQEYKAVGGTVTATRYYSHGGAAVAVRTPTGLSWLAADHQASANLTVNATTGAVQRRRYTPTATTAPPKAPGPPTEASSTNKPTNTSTSLIDVGAREYDPNLGTFLTQTHSSPQRTPPPTTPTSTQATTQSPTATRPASPGTTSANPSSQAWSNHSKTRTTPPKRNSACPST